MPSVSKAQKNAMRAACYGKSTIGIPKSVGCEFAAADKAKSARVQSAHGLSKKRKR